MIDTQYWNKRRHRIYSSVGGWKVGEAVYSHGYDLLNDLAGSASYMQILSLNITGRLPSKELAEWMEVVFSCLSWPDPRIWCNAVGALAGETKASVVAATTAGVLAADSEMYGSRPLQYGTEFIQQLLMDYKGGRSLPALLEEGIKRNRGKVKFVGYARPIATGDERVEVLQTKARALGFSVGEHESLGIEVHEYLQQKYSETININGYVAAFMSDQGYSPRELYNLAAVSVLAGVEACYLEYSANAYGSYLPQRCDDVEYIGPKKRPVPSS